MKKILLLCLAFVMNAFAQIQDPVKVKIDTLEQNGQLILKASVQIDKDWHIYAVQSTEEQIEFPPIASELVWEKNTALSPKGALQEIGVLHKVYEEVFEAKVRYYEDSVVFTQPFEAKDKQGQLKGAFTYQACTNGMCLPPQDVDFSFELAQNNAVESTGVEAELSFWGIFLAGFAGGMIALLTPCVFPMIPVTVSFFTRKQKKRTAIFKALIYGLSIIAIYVSLGRTLTIFAGADALNALASNGFVNFAFFAIFIVFAISFLGGFEIRLPASWLTKADKKADQGGWIGIFFMAFTLALVSFSCTGPLIGTLLVQVALTGSYLAPALGMLGFSTALAFPFTFFALFPSALGALPKSGSWLGTVKVCLGFVEIALALKFLSVVDLAYHWEFLTREIFIALWVAVFFLMTLYLLGFLPLGHEEKPKHLPLGNFFVALLSLGFTLYLLPGLWGAPLKLLSGIAPPITHAESDFQFSKNPLSETQVLLQGAEKGVHGLSIYKDYASGLAAAKKLNKPILLDFTGYACVNCRKMEEHVWSDSKVLNLLSQYVLVSLYVDDKTELPENAQYISAFSGKKIKTVGARWSDFQAEHFGANAQPFYVTWNPNTESVLQAPVGYVPNVDLYAHFLAEGLAKFKKQ